MLAREEAEAATQQRACAHRRARAAHCCLGAVCLVVHIEVQLAEAGATLHNCSLLVGSNLQRMAENRRQCNEARATNKAAGTALAQQPVAATIEQPGQKRLQL